jgi:hypothetical protein
MEDDLFPLAKVYPEIKSKCGRYRLQGALQSMRPTSTLLIITVALLSTASAFVYQEETQGDIDGFGAPPTFSLSFGLNTISGSSYFGTVTNPDADFDAFGFIIPEGGILSLDSLVFEYTLTGTFGDIRSLGISFCFAPTGPDGTWSKTQVLSHTLSEYGRGFSYLYSDGSNPNTSFSSSPLNLEFFDVVNGYLDPYRPSSPLGSGLHWIYSGMEKSGLGSFGGSWDYSLTMTVISVPEPSSVLLSTAGCAMLLRRPRRAS